MTRPPFDPYGQNPLRPVDHPAGGRGPHPPGAMPYPAPMNPVQTTVTGAGRPGAVVVAFVLWLLASLTWPVGTLARDLVAGEADAGWSAFDLFLMLCFVVLVLWGALSFLFGRHAARVALCGGAFLAEALAVVHLVVAVRDGTGYTGAALVVGWLVLVLRVVLPPLAVTASFVPATRGYFAASGS
ncbi:hypothetical protein [Umezawaea beigongshangensis]|uniref:hypothetical protein n=1 Tax=Umezawaea beigongshangensis TaxID=2780383 RepID=UPI0018F19185|nr:hypothetical protein [Umezawaea beigongshangensis]